MSSNGGGPNRFPEQTRRRNETLNPYMVVRKAVVSSVHPDEDEAIKAAQYEHPQLGKGTVVSRRSGKPIDRVLP
jgi:hypothetical protein